MAKQLHFNWQRPVPEELLTGETLDRIDEDGCVVEPNCLVKVDEYGFFIYWTSEGKEGQVIECSEISDIRADSPLKTNGNGGFNNNATDPRIVCICSGLDFVNINYTYFMAKADSSAERWCSNLRSITHNYKANNVCPTMQLQKHWLKLCLMVNCNGKIPVRSITRTFASGKTEKMVMSALEELGLPGGKNEEIETTQFTFERFIALYHKICPRTDIIDLFAKISYHKDHMTASQLLDFMNNHQRDPRLNEILCPFYDLTSVVQLIRRYETNPKNLEKDPPWLSLDAFCQYLMSDENAPMFLDRLDIYQEMDHPLSHYYVNSSHNTYLVGRQFGGKSSVEMYRQVLIAGCRCIELDCWDGPNNEPIITHGKAMCTDIGFKEVIAAIKDTAFIASDYPVILSFENHCSKSQQEKLADYCQKQFGDMLLKECLPDVPLKPGVPLPSPNQLKRKILIKNKRLKAEVEKEQLERFYKGERSVVESIDTSSSVDGEDSVVEDMTSEELAHPENNSSLVDMLTRESQFVQMKAKHDAGNEDKINMKMVGKLDSLSNDDESQIISQYHYESATTNIHPVLSSLVNYVQPVKFQNFDVAEERGLSYHVSSLSEPYCLGLIKSKCLDLINYNKRQLSRIYPKGGRVDSSNYMPQIFWNAGCQMVSLNFQTPDLAMQLNQGKFEYNGNCGYLLKPDFMRRPDREFDPFSECPVDGVIAAHCTVRVISGQFLSDKKVGTYVEVDMFGLPTDTIRRENRTKVVPNNGLNPIYNSEPFIFRKIVLPDLAVLRIGVYEESNRLIGQRILPLDGLQAGFRHISLRTEGNFPLSLPTVFCEIVLKTYIPDGLDSFVNALSDPRKFSSMADDRARQMKNMGIDESDIAELNDLGSKPKVGGKERTPQLKLANSDSVPGAYPITSQRSVQHQSSVPESEFKFEATGIDTLKQLREYTKLCKQLSKDLASLRKRHHKEKMLAQKTHRSTNSASATEAANRKSLRRKGLPKSRSESEVQTLVTIPELEHSPVWKCMIARHVEEEITVRTSHVDKQRETLQSLLTSKYHEAQLKELTAKQDREMKELSVNQTKSSLLTKKQLTTANDKTIKSKAEADRRMKEINENNTKKFRDERQWLTSKHNGLMQRLKTFQKRELTQVHSACDEEKSSIAKEYNTEILEKIETVI